MTSENNPNQILGILKAGVTEESARIAIEKLNLSIVKTSSNGRLTSVLIDSVVDFDKSMQALTESGCFEALQPNHLSRHDV